MNNSDKKRFAMAMGTMSEVFDRKTSSLVAGAYFNTLIRFPVETVEAAIATAISECRYFPKPVELIEIIEGPKAEKATMQDLAMEQAEEVIRQVREIGSYQSPALDDPITNRLLNTRWSWKSLCAMTETEHKWWVKNFVEAYQSSVRVDGNMQIENKKLKSLTCGIGNIE